MYLSRLLVSLLLVESACAATVTVGTAEIAIPSPQGYVEVTPEMNLLWKVIESAQGEGHILAAFIPVDEVPDAIEGDSIDLDRNITIGTARKFERMTLSRDFFEQFKQQLKAIAASTQMDAIVAKEMARINGKLDEAIGFKGKLDQLGSMTFPEYIELPDQFGYSEVSVQQTKMPDGTIDRERITTTSISLFVKGKILNCYVTGGQDDLEWTRTTAKQLADAILLAN